MFYSDDNATTAIGNTSTMATTGISLKKAKINGDTSTNDNTSPYKIRLPKNARSFIISSNDSTLGSSVIHLYETVNVKSADGTIWISGDDPHIQIANYHHAGTTFTVDNNGNVTAKTLRTGKSVPTQTITDPLTPRTDNDYIYLTDVGNHFASNNTVYAYYYGGADGEYTQWSGVKASTSDNAPLVYTDNDGNMVYMFQLPRVSDGKYPYVIFNNGSATDNTRKITQKIDIMEMSHDSVNNIDVYSYTAGGTNYRVDALNTDDIQHYGTYNSTAGSYVQAYPATQKNKEDGTTEYYSSNKMIYVINNGTNQLDNTEKRLVFDDMHIIFYDNDKNPLGKASSGYKPDKLMNGDAPVNYTDAAGTAGQGNIYRISVPNDAMYFRITNGTKDGDTNQYMRQSELKSVTANGLYRFVPSTENVVDYIEENIVSGDIEKKHFLLELVNEIKNDDEEPPESETYDVKLATVVTGADGKQEKIIWLKLNAEGNEVDKNYLDHKLTDIQNEETNPNAKVTEVRVIVDAGKCYWKETAAPAGYKLQTEKIPVTSLTTKVIDEKLPDQVILKKTAKEKVGINDVGSALAGAKFRLVTVNNDNTLGDCVSLAKRKMILAYCL